ncbi:hypothetical protein NEUTE1DRAFT_116447 [Neurospora tetrasperma FGSC 2508]|uniref:Uncharacterized protein n=1 Tax=Neurospora tetrasperma (strain FGSC 2508 / ATCC MYA-4615 / P0657) TaxID=510951 RepID=F8MFK2_NEUT8|nr:uncharacterized protein NEUTE1DRAFT_116447 [Neurospora tetrasperma FGSC 2508]EGO59228.1 hypothetical protein NEUTE1DRAFT_116447 [Neurospora tetrasperma FGSC 2508]
MGKKKREGQPTVASRRWEAVGEKSSNRTRTSFQTPRPSPTTKAHARTTWSTMRYPRGHGRSMRRGQAQTEFPQDGFATR